MRACKVWGYPDHIHKWHDHRMYGDVDTDADTIVFANKCRENYISEYSWQDHEVW